MGVLGTLCLAMGVLGTLCLATGELGTLRLAVGEVCLPEGVPGKYILHMMIAGGCNWESGTGGCTTKHIREECVHAFKGLALPRAN